MLSSHKEGNAPGYKVSKTRVTILACANATGEHKLEEENPVQEMLQALACLKECTDCDEANVEEWLWIDASDPGYTILSDDEIVQRVTNPEIVETDVSDSDELHDVQP